MPHSHRFKEYKISANYLPWQFFSLRTVHTKKVKTHHITSGNPPQGVKVHGGIPTTPGRGRGYSLCYYKTHHKMSKCMREYPPHQGGVGGGVLTKLQHNPSWQVKVHGEYFNNTSGAEIPLCYAKTICYSTLHVDSTNNVNHRPSLFWLMVHSEFIAVHQLDVCGC